MFDDAPIYLLEVAVPVPLRQLYSYSHSSDVLVGARVEVKFSGRILVAIVLASRSISQEDLPISLCHYHCLPICHCLPIYSSIYN